MLTLSGIATTRSQLTTKLSGSKGLQLQHQRLLTVRSDDLLAEKRTNRPQVPPHNQPPECFRLHRSPLTTALADNLLSAFGSTDQTQTTASTTNLLGAFGSTGDLEEQVQGLCAEPANNLLHRIFLDNALIRALRSSVFF